MTAEVTFGTILAFGGYVIAGALGLFSFFSKSRKDTQTESDAVAKKLIDNLQATVDLQEKTISRLETDMNQHSKMRDTEIKKLTADFSHLQGRNSLLEELFKGQDPKMKEFYAEAPKLFVAADRNFEAINKLENTLSSFLEKMTTLLPNAIPSTVPVTTTTHIEKTETTSP